MIKRSLQRCVLAIALGGVMASPAWCANRTDASWKSVASRVVKLYGAGGVSGIEGYQTGLLVSDSARHSPGQLVLTVDGVLLESGEAIVVLSNGDRYTGRVAGVDLLTGVTVLRMDSEETLTAFDLNPPTPGPVPGDRIRVLSNAFNIAVGDEPVSLQQGVVAARVPLHRARRVPPLLSASPVLLVDCVTSNPGAAGGAVVDLDGQLFGMVGKELRSDESGTWVNYAVPTPLLHEALARAMATDTDSATGESTATPSSTLPSIRPQQALQQMVAYGIHLIPAISLRTPAYVEQIRPDSPAANAGLLHNDLIVLVDGRSTATLADAQREILSSLAQESKTQLTVLRGEELISIELMVGVAHE